MSRLARIIWLDGLDQRGGVPGGDSESDTVSGAVL